MGKQNRNIKLWKESIANINFFFIFYLFIFFFYFRECDGARRAQEERERISSSLPLSMETDAGLDPTTLELWPELKSRVGGPTYWATQGPWLLSFFLSLFFFCLSIEVLLIYNGPIKTTSWNYFAIEISIELLFEYSMLGFKFWGLNILAVNYILFAKFSKHP